jgi:hypothetical protein
MTQTYSTETIAKQLQEIDVPFADCVARALVGLLTARKASVQSIANLMPGDVSTEAKRQQIRRFLDQPVLAQHRWARVLANLLPTSAPWVLAIDRTEWTLGQEPINLLVLSVVCAGCAVPLLWLPLQKPGASDTAERITLMQHFVRLFGVKCIRFVSADREFIGKDWVQWLQTNKVPFRIRIKAGEWLQAKDGRRKRAGEWFAYRACRCKPQPMLLWGLSVYVGAKRLRRGRSESLIVISNERGEPLEDYRLRWKIETLFQAFKGRGFDMESCQMTDPLRWSSFLGFLSLALSWCLLAGEFLEHLEPMRLKNHGRPAQSVFRRGFDHVQALVAPLSGRAHEADFIVIVRLIRRRELK